MRLKFICCEILYREACFLVSQSANRIDLEFMKKGLHDVESSKMREKLQAAIDRASEEKYDYILLGYGLCNNGTAGLKARNIPLVIPRVHDCISIFMGSASRYAEYFNDNPGVYYYTSGWIERNDDESELKKQSIPFLKGMEMPYEELVAKYGEDNAKYLYETMQANMTNYSCFTYIGMGLGPEVEFENFSKAQAKQKGWDYKKIDGKLILLENLLEGQWNDSEFIVVPPGAELQASYEDGIFKIRT